MVRTDAHQLRPIAGDTPAVEGIKLVARAHQTLIWKRHRHVLRLRSALREYFPAALAAFDDLTASDTPDLLSAAPDPARLSRSRIGGALKRAGAAMSRPTPRASRPSCAPHSSPSPPSWSRPALRRHRLVGHRGDHRDEQPDCRDAGQVEECLAGTRTRRSIGASPASVRSSAPGEFGDDPDRYAGARARKNYAGSARSPTPRGRRPWCWPGSCATTASPTPCTNRGFCALTPHQGRGHTTTSSGPVAPGITPRCASSATVWSESCTLPQDPQPLRRAHFLGAPHSRSPATAA